MRDFIAFCLLLASIVTMAASVIAIVRPLPKIGMATRKRALAGIGIAALLFIATAIIIPAPSLSVEEADAVSDVAEGSVAASDKQIAEVRSVPETKFASVKVDLDQGWSADDVPVRAAMIVEAAGKAIKAGAPDVPTSIKTIDFWFTAPMTDIYGKDTRGKVLQLRFETAALRHVRYDRVSPQGLLNLAGDIEVRAAARKGVAKYCEDNADKNAIFCKKVGRI